MEKHFVPNDFFFKSRIFSLQLSADDRELTLIKSDKQNLVNKRDVLFLVYHSKISQTNKSAPNFRLLSLVSTVSFSKAI